MCREFAASPIATREELEEHLRAALALERLRGEERRERAGGRLTAASCGGRTVKCL